MVIATGFERTVGHIIRSLFPLGTRQTKPGLWDECPLQPSDVFAAAALVLERSGAYSALRHIDSPLPPEPTCAVLQLSKKDRAKAKELGDIWRITAPSDAQPVPPELANLWSKLWSSESSPIFMGDYDDPGCPPEWWGVALQLLIAADEAALRAGFMPKQDEWFPKFIMAIATKKFEKDGASTNANVPENPTNPMWTIAPCASPDVVCVLPKSRTAAVGNTVRSLSHNLALLPPRGLVEANWSPNGSANTSISAGKPLNLLLIPFPYRIDARSFKSEVICKTKKIGWFDVEPCWLKPRIKDEHDYGPTQFADFVTQLVVSARRDCSGVHGVVLPELALSFEYYVALRNALKASNDIELIISGVSNYQIRDFSNKKNPRALRDIKGNFAITTRMVRDGGPSEFIEFAQPKHHRWKLDGGQIRRYGLGGSLDPNFTWWEKIDLSRRRVHISTLRDSTTMTTLLCEDLARIDPSQSVLRAIGPNLVVALLMDGPQLGRRWSARGATVLAEDPGCSVLTLSSMGLIQRMNHASLDKASDCIALWKEDSGSQRELRLPTGNDALLVTLSAVKREETTLDGRSNSGEAISWSLTGEIPVRAPKRCDWMEG